MLKSVQTAMMVPTTPTAARTMLGRFSGENTRSTSVGSSGAGWAALWDVGFVAGEEAVPVCAADSGGVFAVPVAPAFGRWPTSEVLKITSSVMLIPNFTVGF